MTTDASHVEFQYPRWQLAVPILLAEVAARTPGADR